MKVARLFNMLRISHTKKRLMLVAAGVVWGTCLFAGAVGAQTMDPDLKPDLRRALPARQHQTNGNKGRANAYVPARGESIQAIRPRSVVGSDGNSRSIARPANIAIDVSVPNAVAAGTNPTRHSFDSGAAHFATQLDFARWKQRAVFRWQ